MPSDNSKPMFIPTPKKVVQNRCKTGEPTVLVLTPDKRVGEHLRLIAVSTAGTTREVVVHHPIGNTNLGNDEWVASDISDVLTLVTRAENPHIAKLKADRARNVNERFINDGLLKESSGEIVYNLAGAGGTTRAKFFSDLRKEHKAQDGKSKEFSIDHALLTSKDVRADLEKEIRNKFSDYLKLAEQDLPDTHVTQGGSRNDRPQVAMKWAKGLPIANLADQLVMTGIEGPPPVAASATAVGASVPVLLNTGADSAFWTNQSKWFDIPIIPKKELKEVKDLLTNLKKVLIDAGVSDPHIMIK